MDSLSKEELNKEYPYTRDNVLFIDEKEARENKMGIKVRFSVNGNLEVETVTLLTKLFFDDRYYEYVKKMIDNKIDEFNIFTSTDNGITKINFTKLKILNGIEEMMKNVTYFSRFECNEELNELKKSVTLESFINKYSNHIYKINIDGELVLIPVINMIKFLQLEDELYEDELSKESIMGIKKEHFLYVMLSFFEENKILNKYKFDRNLFGKITDIKYSSKIDIQSLNMITSTIDSMSKHITINDSLYKEILRDMPNNLKEIEKAVYIYIKMCKILTYDEEFYVEGQTGDVLKKHALINSISKITPKNNKVVCYEFNAIYAKLLEELGINYIVSNNGIHSNLTFRSGKYIVDADSVVSILRGDLFNAKLNLPLTGLSCKNVNFETKKEFEQVINMMYLLIPNNVSTDAKENFSDVAKQYKKDTDQSKVSLNEKISILINKVSNLKLDKVDAISYIKHLEIILFTLKERRDNISISIIRNNNSLGIPAANVVFTLNEKSIEQNENENIYIYYDLNSNVVPIKKEELQRKFDTKELSYIYNDSHRIPGIKIGGEVYDERFKRVK